jgi:hypothetical protein
MFLPIIYPFISIVIKDKKEQSNLETGRGILWGKKSITSINDDDFYQLNPPICYKNDMLLHRRIKIK